MVSTDIRWLEPNDPDAKRARWVDVGNRANEFSAPDAVCLLSLNGTSLLGARLWKSCDELYTFRDAVFWQGMFVIGWGDAVYVIDPESTAVTRHDLDAYFGSIYAGDVLLVASAERVVRLDPNGHVLWTSGPVGMDGVTISDVRDGYIDGDGEWDPPGGWKAFRLRLSDGIIVPCGDEIGPEAT